MAKNLVIVESPAKAATIEKYLGADYKVIASMGHVRDLPASKLGVDVEQQFVPQYVIPPKARKTIKALKDALKGKEHVYLATDLDREGEAISWHISQALDLADHKVKVSRITFDEITKAAITEAIKHPREIDVQLVDAQQARRVLDRLVGYTLSPVLWKKIYKGLSAGRVQSVALRLIVERERERQAFKPVEYWSVTAKVAEKPSSEPFSASLVEYGGAKIEKMTVSSKEEADAIEAGLKGAAYTVAKVEAKPVKRRPAAPYTTSTMQQDAVNRLGLSSKRVMQLAQRLYEAGHITYMRTDSVALAAEAVAAIRGHVSSQFGPEYLPSNPNSYQNKSKGAQEAHEAIRPTDPTKSGSQVSDDPAGQRLYELIRRRALASQMKDAELESTAVSIATSGSEKPATFRATGQRIVFPGFLAAIGVEDKEESILPGLTEGQVLTLKELLSDQHFTEPPPRFSEATLIKALEEAGIGRPSTYAPTMDTLVQRNYVHIEQRRFIPEEAGYLVTDLLVNHFPDIVDTTFTADMEEKLDKVAEGQESYGALLQTFWKPFHALVEESMDKIEKINTEESTDEVCPTCGKPMVVKRGRFGKFLACSGFPECKTTKPLSDKAPSGLICPICGKELAEKRARRGMFFGCTGYPSCTFAIWKRDGLVKKIADLEAEGTALPFKEQALAAAAASVPEVAE